MTEHDTSEAVEAHIESYEHRLPRSTRDMLRRLHARAVEAEAVLARPDVAALLAGEAVAVPREATQEMIDAALVRQQRETEGLYFSIYRAMLAASPYAKEPKA